MSVAHQNQTQLSSVFTLVRDSDSDYQNTSKIIPQRIQELYFYMPSKKSTTKTLLDWQHLRPFYHKQRNTNLILFL